MDYIKYHFFVERKLIYTFFYNNVKYTNLNTCLKFRTMFKYLLRNSREQNVYITINLILNIPEFNSRTRVDMALVTESAATSRSLRKLLLLLLVVPELLVEPARDDDDEPRNLNNVNKVLQKPDNGAGYTFIDL